MKNIKFNDESRYSEIVESAMEGMKYLIRVAFIDGGSKENVERIKQMVEQNPEEYRTLIKDDLYKLLKESITFTREVPDKNILDLDDDFDVEIFRNEVMRRLENKCIELVKNYEYKWIGGWFVWRKLKLAIKREEISYSK